MQPQVVLLAMTIASKSEISLGVALTYQENLKFLAAHSAINPHQRLQLMVLANV